MSSMLILFRFAINFLFVLDDCCFKWQECRCLCVCLWCFINGVCLHII